MERFEDLTQNPLAQIVLIILIALALQYIMHHYIGRIIRKIVKSHKYESRKVERQREDTLIRILKTSSSVIIWAVSILLVLSVLGINVAALATGAGLIGVVVGFGAQSTVKDLLAGVFIIAENQYRVGDIVAIAGKSGVVEDISIRVTRLRDLDGYLHIVPNGIIDTVTNMTFDYANVNLNISISYDTDIEKVKKVINDVGSSLAKQASWKESFLEPIAFLRIDSFDDSAVTIKALGKVAPGTQWDIAGEFRRQLKMAFDEKDIEIPFPQRVVHTIKEK